jgi:uncharacterized protein (UPF0147 family)
LFGASGASGTTRDTGPRSVFVVAYGVVPAGRATPAPPARHAWLALAGLAVGGACAVLVSAPPVAAQAVATTDQAAQESATARFLFEEGLDFVARKDWRNAEDRFRRVIALRSSHVAAYNLASALDHLARPVEAAELLRAILRDTAAPKDTRTAAEKLLAQVEPRIGTVIVRASGDATDCEVLLDDKAQGAGAFGRALGVEPGEHEVAVRRDGEVIASRTVRVGGGQPLRAEVTIELAPRGAPPAAAAPPPAPVSASEAVAPAPVAPAPKPAEARVEASLASPSARDEDGALTDAWWFWTGTGVVAVGAAVAIVVLVSGVPDARPIAGDTEPSVVRGVVVGAMP